MHYVDSLHTLYIGDASYDPLAGELPSTEALLAAYQSMIISASGWRKVFAASADEDDPGSSVNTADRFLTALATLAFSKYFGPGPQEILVGLDARPTGQILGAIAVRILTALGHRVRYLFVSAAPEIMAASIEAGCDGFFYVSASHNPIGHNGFKMGSQGGVFSPDLATKIASLFTSLIEDTQASLETVQALSASVSYRQCQQIFGAVDNERERANRRYRNFALQTATGSTDFEVHEAYIRKTRVTLAARPLGIVGELNGSARSASIDAKLLTDLGVRLSLYNDRPGKVVHDIVPEGQNLSLCRNLLEQHYRRDRSYLIGYSVDNDGDRGNIVYIDERTETAKILDAQSVFALSVLSEFAQSRLIDPHSPLGTVVNGPTSLRIDLIAENFDAAVWRAEVGEANVVTLAEQVRADGTLVPILGEGSNGGNITHPARVRDPLNTLLTFIQLLRNRAIAELWFSRLNLTLPDTYTLADIIESLPEAITTETVASEALKEIQSDHGSLKSRYEERFLAEWPDRLSTLEHWDITDYAVHQMEGSTTRIGLGPEYRSEPYTGGFKVLLLDSNQRPKAFMWMRGSKTEPVYRLMVDVLGSDLKLYTYLLAWHHSLVEQADQT
ncbi:MAG TPA: phosphoglucomutase [Sphaerochaeta sp.]|nr:phosphoglucomutase [Sphaerochaeta sp.]